ncbi:MAG: hypothetical protein ACI8P3_000248 [Saprospiraceae bacterium]|jgi:hypothetical protein
MKRNNWPFLLLFCLFFSWQSAAAQVVFREFLSQDHQGELKPSVNYPGQQLTYEWIFIDMEKGLYFAEGEAIQKIRYRLKFNLNGKEIGHFDVQMRDLIVTHYIEISLVRDQEPRTITCLYNKASRWIKLKGVLPDNCRREGATWGRLDGVESYDQLLQFIISQIDKNVKLSCYF